MYVIVLILQLKYKLNKQRNLRTPHKHFESLIQYIYMEFALMYCSALHMMYINIE